MSETTRNILTSEEKTTLKRLKTGWKYALIPVIFTVAWVFGEALFGTEPAVAFRELTDYLFVYCSIFTFFLSFLLHHNGLKIDRAADGNKDNFHTVNRLVNTRRNLFLFMATVILASYISGYVIPLLSFSSANLSGKNSLAIFWFVGLAAGGFKECDKIIPVLEKAGRI